MGRSPNGLRSTGPNTRAQFSAAARAPPAHLVSAVQVKALLAEAGRHKGDLKPPRDRLPALLLLLLLLLRLLLPLLPPLLLPPLLLPLLLLLLLLQLPLLLLLLLPLLLLLLLLLFAARVEPSVSSRRVRRQSRGRSDRRRDRPRVSHKVEVPPGSRRRHAQPLRRRCPVEGGGQRGSRALRGRPPCRSATAAAPGGVGRQGECAR
jgi:hypothetical protein